MAGYLGNTQKISGRYTVDEFTSSGGTTYTLSSAPGDKNNIQVSAGGLVQYPSAYSVSGTTLTLSGVPSGQKVVVRHMGDTIPFPLLDDNVVTTAKIAAGAVGTTDIADDAVTLAKLSATGTASASNFLRGDNSWQAAGGGAWNFISTAVADDDASVTVTGMSDTYDSYAIIISQMIPQTDGQNLSLRLGDSSGIDSGSTDYAYCQNNQRSSSSTLSVNAVAGTTAINIDAQHGVGNATGEGFSAIMYILQPSSGAVSTMVSWTAQVTTAETASTVLNSRGVARRTTVISHDRIQMFMGSGNITSGRMTLYGIAHS